MKFWDSSAIVPLVVSECETATCKHLLEKDPDMIVWAFTVTEVLSAIHRKIREGTLPHKELPSIRERLSNLQEGWSEVIQLEVVRQKANRLLAIHPLRAADSLQLAAALVASDDQPEGEEMVTFDKNLADAARREGFRVIPSQTIP